MVKAVSITTEYIKLDAFLKFSGISISGGDAKQDILQGKVSVNGEVCTMRGKKLRVGDKISVNGHELEVVGE